MPGDLLDSHELQELENITCQPLGHPQIGVEKLQLFNGSLPAVGTDDLPIQAADPDPGWPEIQVPDPPSLLTVDSPGWLPTDMTDGTKPLVGNCMKVGIPDFSGNLLAENTDSREGEIVGYT